MTRALWIEFRRSPAKWMAPLVVLAMSAIAYARYGQWHGVWSQTSMVVQFGVAMATPLLAAAAAGAALQRRRSGMGEQSTAAARDPWLRETTTVAAVLLWALLPVALVLIAVSVISAPIAGAGGPWPGLVVNAMGLCALATGYGYLLGTSLPSPFTVAAAGFSTAVAIFAVGQESPWAFYSLNGYPDQVVSWPGLTVRLAFATSVLVAAVAAGAARDWRRVGGMPTVVTRSVSAALVLACAAAVSLSGPLQTDRVPLGHEECTDTYPRVCLWPEHRRYLPTAATYVGRFNELSEFFVLPDDPYMGRDAFYEVGIRGEVGDEVSLHFGEYGIARGMVAYAMTQTGFPGCVVEAQDLTPELDAANWALYDWFTAYIMGVGSASEMGVNLAGTAAVDEVLTRDREAQFAWARDQLASLRAPCDVQG